MHIHEDVYKRQGEPCWPMMPDIDYRIETDSQDTK